MVWFCKTKIWWKNKIVLYGYRQICCIHKKYHIYEDVAEDVEARLDTSNYQLDGSYPKGKNKTVIRLIKDKLGVKLMSKLVRWRGKTYNYLIDDVSENKKQKAQKSVP